MEEFSRRRPDDLLVLHFSGHGVKDDSGELYFATTDTQHRRLGSTTLSAGFVNRQMTQPLPAGGVAAGLLLCGRVRAGHGAQGGQAVPSRNSVVGVGR